MPFSVVVGCQWGDEGKGKIVDHLSADCEWVARFQGGANAGHTVVVNGRHFILHLIPSGILRSGVHCALGNGMVIDPEALLAEIQALEEGGISCRPRIRVSALAHVVTPLHKIHEVLTAQDRAIGTTGRGIGPAYEDRSARTGMRCEDLIDPPALAESLRGQWGRLEPLAAAAGTDLETLLGCSREELQARLGRAGRELAPLVGDVSAALLAADRAGARILCEGAQGTWLDVDHGTYPYVTSSHTIVGGACTGLGIPPQRITKVYGVVKAYTTRVGLGPFPTEFSADFADGFRERAGEYGATTRRARRCGWFDAVLVRQSCRLNGVDELVVTKLDVLSGMSRILFAASYTQVDATPRDAGAAPAWLSARTLARSAPRYEELPGWSEDLTGARSLADLPPAARGYAERLGEACGAPVALLSVGPGREQTFATNP